jgi:hypothetical protein
VKLRPSTFLGLVVGEGWDYEPCSFYILDRFMEKIRGTEPPYNYIIS